MDTAGPRAGESLSVEETRGLLAADAAKPFALRHLAAGSRAMVPAGAIAVPDHMRLPNGRLSVRIKTAHMRSLAIPPALARDWFTDALDRMFRAIADNGLPWRDQAIDVYLTSGKVRRGTAQLLGDWHMDRNERAEDANGTGYQFTFANTLPTLQGALVPGTPIHPSVREGTGLVDPRAIAQESIAATQAGTLNLMSPYVIHRGDQARSGLRRVFGAVTVTGTLPGNLSVDRRGPQYVPEIG